MSALTPEGGEAATRQVLRGAGTNALGLLARVLDPLFEIFVARVLGSGIFAVYRTALPLVESAATLTVAGYQDGIVALAGRHVTREAEQPRVYQIMANALVVALVVSVVVCFGTLLLGPGLLTRHFSAELVQGGLVPAVQLMIFSVPCVALINLVSAATRTLLIMRYSASLAAARTLILFPLVALAALGGFGLVAVPAAWLAASVLLAGAAVVVFRRHYDSGLLREALRHFSWSGELTRFALPQNLNMALNTLLPGMGALMLGLLGAGTMDIAIYAAGAGMLQTIRQIRIIGSSAFAPMVVRLHADGKHADLAHTMSEMMGWTLRLAVPAILLVVLFRRELLGLYGLYSPGLDLRFMLVLAVVPLINCLCGYAGNVVVMTGHSQWNLLNSSTGIVIAAGLSWLLIPQWGLLGAATGGAASALVVGTLELWESGHLVGIRPALASLRGPLVAGLAAAAVVFGWEYFLAPTTLLARLGGAVAAGLVYLGGLVALRSAGFRRPA